MSEPLDLPFPADAPARPDGTRHGGCQDKDKAAADSSGTTSGTDAGNDASTSGSATEL